MKAKIILIASMFLFGTCITGCKSKPVELTDLSVYPESISFVYGSEPDSQQITVTTIPENASDVTFTWWSDNNAVASVSPTGLVTATGIGSTNIKVVANNQKGKVVTVTVGKDQSQTPQTVTLYQRELNDQDTYPELILNSVASEYTAEGLEISGKNGLIRLNKYYALSDRLIRYHVRFSNDAKVIFQSSTGDFTAGVDIVQKTISIETRPVTSKRIDFMNPAHEYLIEIYKIYQTAKVRIVDLTTGQSDEIEATNDGSGGVGIGAVNVGFSVGMQRDYYCFGLQEGTSLLVKQITVISGASDLILLIYGDSITGVEGYYPKKDYPQSWTQLVMNQVQGHAMSSGRGGGRITDVLERIKNELPYIKAKYVMVTIGTNTGNTEANLSELVEYIMEQGSIPILNNIPSNESGTQITSNQLIEQVRQKYQIKGCKFDLATSIENDGKEVDKSAMYHEDYSSSTGLQVWHHPNVKGSLLMFNRTLTDVPEIYE